MDHVQQLIPAPLTLSHHVLLYLRLLTYSFHLATVLIYYSMSDGSQITNLHSILMSCASPAPHASWHGATTRHTFQHGLFMPGRPQPPFYTWSPCPGFSLGWFIDFYICFPCGTCKLRAFTYGFYVETATHEFHMYLGAFLHVHGLSMCSQAAASTSVPPSTLYMHGFFSYGTRLRFHDIHCSISTWHVFLAIHEHIEFSFLAPHST